jgi:hypothetical protein
MKHVQTFENFINDLEKKTLQDNTNESFVNESELGSITSIIYDEESRKYKKFWKTAKKGDTFMFYPAGIDEYFIDKKDMTKDIIKPTVVYRPWPKGDEYYPVMKGAKDKKCTIIERKPVKIQGVDEIEEDTPFDTIFYTMEGEPSTKIFLIPEMS